ncbi:prepilin-type N-terminal cleavage/methylation domain-containing protein [Candidatus Omnitrophota bacterium]
MTWCPGDSSKSMYYQAKKGFTLVEILVALLILGIGLSLIYAIFPLGIRISRDVQTLGRVSFFAQKKLEELKTMNGTPEDSNGDEPNFSWNIKVQDYTGEDNIALKKIQIDVQWPQGQDTRKKTFVTYFKY